MASETSLLPDSGDTNLLSGRRKGSRPHNIETLASVPVNLEDNFLLEDLKSPIKTPRSPTKKKKNTVPSQLFPKVHYNRTESPAETSSAGRMRYNAQGGVGLTSPKKTGAGSNRERNRLPLIKTSYHTTNQGELAEQPLR